MVRIRASCSEEQWKSVMFSGENSLTVRLNMQRKKIWRMEGKRYNSSNLVPSFKFGYVHILTWAGFSARRRAPLVPVAGNLKQKRYKYVLEANVVSFLIEHCASILSVTFQQDNCGLHRAKYVKEYLKASVKGVMKSPAQIPDLNPIENTRSMLKRMLRRV